MEIQSEASPIEPRIPDSLPSHLAESGRRHFVDTKFVTDLDGYKDFNRLFLRASGKDRTFKRVDFRYSIFDCCYFRNCVFDSCDFTGCRFINSNFRGSNFQSCKFDYANFEKTWVDPALLNHGAPAAENLKLIFVRSLRMNFQSLGDAAAVNRAIALELEATELHLKKSWNSTESYYRGKYKGWDRFFSLLRWSRFKVMHAAWGNGESAWKLLGTTAVILAGMVVIHLFKVGNLTGRAILEAVSFVPQIFLGVVTSPAGYGGGYLALILTVRLILFGFFMSILIKRANRR